MLLLHRKEKTPLFEIQIAEFFYMSKSILIANN